MNGDSAPLYAWKQTMVAARSLGFQAGEAIVAAVAGLIAFGATFGRLDAVNAYSLVAAAGLGAPAIGLALLFVIQWLRAPYVQRDEARRSGQVESGDELHRTIEQLGQFHYDYVDEDVHSTLSANQLLVKYADKLAVGEFGLVIFSEEFSRDSVNSFIGELQLYGVFSCRKQMYRLKDGHDLTEAVCKLTPFGIRVIKALRDMEAPS